MNANSLYQEDLAHIHHTGFGDFARNAAPQLLRLLRAAGIRGGTLLDLACGSGIWPAIAQRHGFQVIGVDQSEAMLRQARQMAPAASFHRASLHDFKLPPCDVVTSIGEGLNYLQPGERLANRLEPLLARIAAALRPGGLLIFDVMIREGEPLSYRRWCEGTDWAVLFEVEENTRLKLLTRKNITFRKTSADCWRRREETHRVQLFTREQLDRALRRAGFAVRVVRKYGEFRLFPRRLGFIARRTVVR